VRIKQLIGNVLSGLWGLTMLVCFGSVVVAFFIPAVLRISFWSGMGGIALLCIGGVLGDVLGWDGN